MKCLTWNLEWRTPASLAGRLILEQVATLDPDVCCYTEVVRTLIPEGYCIYADPDYGYPNKGGRRKVVLWSKHPWTEVDATGDEAMPTGRFVSGVTGGIRFVGVCIPWRAAHVSSGRQDRRPWEDHLSYCSGLGRVLERYSADGVPICVLGDYNQRIPRVDQPVNVAKALTDAIPADFRIVTEGMKDSEDKDLIDHLAVSHGLLISDTQIVPRYSHDGTKLSDHVGIMATLEHGKSGPVVPPRLPVAIKAPVQTKRARPPVTPVTVGEALYWSYANLGMAYASKRHTAATYQRLDYIVRNKLYHGLLKGTLQLGSFFKDEQSKIAAQVCCYCGSDARLSLDHLVPQFSGGAHSADNLVVACRSCNSSKGKRDFLDWMALRKQFPPLKPLRRYLKLVMHYCVERDLMAVPLDAVNTISPAIPFSLWLLPNDYPAPHILRGHPEGEQPAVELNGPVKDG